MSDVRGFTLAEVLIAMALAAIVAGIAYVLLDSGLAMHDRSSDVGLSTVGMARAMTMMRADLASSASITHAGTDSLVVAMPNGDDVEWAARTTSDGLEVFRSVDEGSGFSEQPKQAVAHLLDIDGIPATVNFTELGTGIVRALLTGDGVCLSIEAAPWEAP